MAAKSIEEALVTKIKATTAITGYIGAAGNARIYFMSAPDGAVTMPYIVLSTLSSPNEANAIGQAGGQAQIQLSIWHSHKQNGLNLSNAVVTAMNHFSGTSDGYSIQYVSATGPVTLKDPDYDNVFHYVVTVYISYDRS